jgi:hypothetical protein
MSAEFFIPMKFHPKTLALVDKVNGIIVEYQARGFTLTLRQTFYQCVSRLILENRLAQYKMLGSTIVNARRAGLIDWDAIEDRTRNLRKLPSWESPADAISAISEQYREDLWASQPHHVEVWIEKDALLGVIEGVCRELRVPYFSHRGNNSEPEQYTAGKRFAGASGDNKRPIVLHLGDHDPNGIDMTRDNRDRLRMFARQPIEVRRLALNMDQVRRYAPPPHFTKEADSRAPAYIAQYAEECWELDALDPTVIAGLIRDEVNSLIDRAAWNEAREADNRALLEAASGNWAKVEKLLRGRR